MPDDKCPCRTDICNFFGVARGRFYFLIIKSRVRFWIITTMEKTGGGLRLYDGHIRKEGKQFDVPARRVCGTDLISFRSGYCYLYMCIVWCRQRYVNGDWNAIWQMVFLDTAGENVRVLKVFSTLRDYFKDCVGELKRSGRVMLLM